MRKGVIITSLILSGILILDSLNFGHAIMMFLVAGLIPGTGIYLDASTTLWLFMGTIGFIAGRLSSRAVIAFEERLKIVRRTA